MRIFFYVTGIVFLALAKGKNILNGYSTPKPFGISDRAKCVDYDIQVVDNWLSYLNGYTCTEYPLSGKKVLELGPGSDLGIGIYLLAKGCLQYNACDVNNLVKSVPYTFYDHLFSKLQCIEMPVTISFLKEQLEKTRTGGPSQLNYIVREDFDISSAFGESTIDLIFSQAAFEHFDDVEKTVSQLSKICKPGAIAVVMIDLQTHSRWIRAKDPNNIYRYPHFIYNLFRFRGIPNRLRPLQYKTIFEKYGWGDISIVPLKKLENHESGYMRLDKPFLNSENQMDYLMVMLCATRMNEKKTNTSSE